MTTQLPFQTIGKRYRIVSAIGAGGMGAVYRVTDRLSGKVVALKHVLLDDPSEMSTVQGDDLRVSLTHEFRTLASLHHPNVINVLDHGFDEDRNPFFTMELIDGAEPITDVGKPKPQNEQINLLVQLLEALWYLHRRSVVHRDLKPANVLVNKDGHVKVLDFGLAAVRHTSMKDAEDVIAGTLAYMAPEVLMQQPASASSDLWAVGVMAYEIFKDRHPFGTQNLGMMIQSIVNDDPDLSGFAEALAEVMRHLLSKSPEQRYVDARKVIEELCEAVGIEIPKESVIIRESFLQASQFVGREPEMDQINKALHHLMTRRPSKSQPSGDVSQAWLIGGESGVGKTRLTDEIRVRSLVQGALVLQGASVFGGGLPFHSWRDPMRRLVLDTELDDLDAAVLKEIVPDIEDLIERKVPEAPSLDRDGRTQRLIGTIVEVFRRQTRPVVLIMEDLQWAVESLEPLKLLVGLVNELPLMVVGNYRNDEKPDLHNDLPGMTHMKLERLPQTAVEELSAAMLGVHGRSPEILDLLKRESEGNAFFIIEVMRALAEEAGGLGSIQSMHIPSQIVAGGIREILRRRLNRLPDTAIGLLKLAAVVGRNLDMPVIQHILASAEKDSTGMPELPADLHAWLVDCANSAVLESVEDQWRFAHDKLREVLVDNLTDDERKVFNRRVAEAIEAVHPDDEGFAEQLADHWHLADNLEKETHFAIIAADQLLAISSFQQCQTLLDRTLKRIPEGQHRAANMRLLKLMGDTHFYLSDFVKAEEFLTASLAIAREIGDKPAEAEALRFAGTVLERRGEHKKAREQYNAALEIWRTQNDQLGIADVLAGLALVDIHDGDLETAHKNYQEGLEIFRKAERQRMTVVCLVGLANVALNKGDLQTAEKHLTEGLEITRATGDRFRISTSLNNLGVINEHLGNMEQAKSYYQQSLDLSREIGDRQGVAIGLTNLGVIAEDEGRYVDAQQHYQEALRYFREIGDRGSISICLQNLGNIGSLTGDYTGAMKHLQEALTLCTEMNDTSGELSTRLLMGNALRQTGMVSDAKEQAETAIKLAQPHDHHSEHARALSLLGHSAYDLKQYDDASTHLEAGVKLAREHEMDKELGDLLIRLGFTQLQLQKNDEATKTLQEALAMGKGSSQGPLILQALTGFARLRFNGKERAKSMQILNVVERQFDALHSDVRQWVDPLYGDLETLPEDDEYLMPPELDALITELLAGYTPVVKG